MRRSFSVLILFTAILLANAAAYGQLDSAWRMPSLYVLDERVREGRRQVEVLDDLKEYYGPTTPKERSLIAPDPHLKERFSKFLSQPNTGIIKLIKDNGCVNESHKVRDAEFCSRYKLPGGGAAFSFRMQDHRMWTLADLMYNGNELFVLGELSQGFITRLENVELDQIDPQIKELKWAFDFVPSSQIKEATEENRKFAAGFTVNGQIYQKGIQANLGKIYFIRSIAYRGELVRNYRGVRFDEMKYDRRRDVSAVFQIIAKDREGNITIIWKILSDKESPKLKK